MSVPRSCYTAGCNEPVLDDTGQHFKFCIRCANDNVELLAKLLAEAKVAIDTNIGTIDQMETAVNNLVQGIDGLEVKIKALKRR